MANASVLDICNAALVDLGEEPIQNLNDSIKVARLCNQRWPAVRDAVLRAHTWNCATFEVELKAVDNPSINSAYAFPLPEDCLRVQMLRDEGQDMADGWEVQGRLVLCEERGPLELTYTRCMEDPRYYDALLVEAMTARLAATLAYPLTASTSLGQAFWNAYGEKLREARRVDREEVGRG